MSTKNKSTEQFTYDCFHSVQANTNSALVLMCFNVNLKIKLYNWEANVFSGEGGKEYKNFSWLLLIVL